MDSEPQWSISKSLKILKEVSHLDQLKKFANNYSEDKTYWQKSEQKADKKSFQLKLYGSTNNWLNTAWETISQQIGEPGESKHQVAKKNMP